MATKYRAASGTRLGLPFLKWQPRRLAIGEAATLHVFFLFASAMERARRYYANVPCALDVLAALPKEGFDDLKHYGQHYRMPYKWRRGCDEKAAVYMKQALAAASAIAEDSAEFVGKGQRDRTLAGTLRFEVMRLLPDARREARAIAAFAGEVEKVRGEHGDRAGLPSS